MRHQQPSHRSKDEFGAFDRETESGGWKEDGKSEQLRRNSFNLNNAQLTDKDLTIMNAKEKTARRSNNHDRPNELILSPNAYQQQMDFTEDGSSDRAWRKTVEDVSRGKCDNLKVGRKSDFQLGARVVISGQQSGVIQYLGNIHSQPGVWAGLELHSPVGLHDGRLDGVEYFRCKPRYGGRREGGGGGGLK